jgi:hypothetical protein
MIFFIDTSAHCAYKKFIEAAHQKERAMFNLPLTGSATRELMGDIAHVVECLDPKNRGKLPTYGEALRKGRRFLAETKAAKRVTFICFGNCNVPSQYQRIILMSVGPRGGHRKEWDFGPA